MRPRQLRFFLPSFCVFLLALLPCFSQKNSGDTPPNVLIFLMDDMGYGDLGCYGAETHATPNIDALASSGRRFTDFYVSQATCTASRASLMSGCYANRLGMGGAAYMPWETKAFPPDVYSLPKLFKDAGYTTSLVGKWHLGSGKKAWPLRYGFDHFFGLPYSADMWNFDRTKQTKYPELPLVWNDSIVAHFRDQSFLTRWYTQHVEGLIAQQKEQPFFLMMNYSLPHVPLEVSPFFQGTAKDMYGDMMQELDWSVGQIIAQLKKQGVYEHTLVLLLSDNGPWRIFGNHGGSVGPLRGSKGTTWEAGVRVPFIASWPGKISPGSVCSEYAMSIDILPTLAAVLKKNIPVENLVDGKNMLPLLLQKKASTPHEALFFYYNQNDLEAVRYKNWKMYFPHGYRDESVEQGNDGLIGVYHRGKTGLELYDLSVDIGEKKNVATQHADVVAQINLLAQKMRSDLGDGLTGTPGRNRRPPFVVE